MPGFGQTRLTFTEPKSVVTTSASRLEGNLLRPTYALNVSTRFGPPFYVLRTVTTSPWHTGRVFRPYICEEAISTCSVVNMRGSACGRKRLTIQQVVLPFFAVPHVLKNTNECQWHHRLTTTYSSTPLPTSGWLVCVKMVFVRDTSTPLL